jgi:hypothetical protein
MARRRDPGPRTHARRRLIESLLAEREETGETYRELEERSGIPAPTLAWWRRRLRDASASEEIEVVEVEPIKLQLPGSHLEIVWPGGAVVRVPPGFDTETLGAVLDLLKAGSC